MPFGIIIQAHYAADSGGNGDMHLRIFTWGIKFLAFRRHIVMELEIKGRFDRLRRAANMQQSPIRMRAVNRQP